jgi:hypothetical protein
VDKGSAGNDSSYLVAALLNLHFNLQSSHRFNLQYFAVNPNLRKKMGGLDHSSDDDMHLICLSRNRELNQWKSRSKLRSIWFPEIDIHRYRCGCCISKKQMR